MGAVVCEDVFERDFAIVLVCQKSGRLIANIAVKGLEGKVIPEKNVIENLYRKTSLKKFIIIFSVKAVNGRIRICLFPSRRNTLFSFRRPLAFKGLYERNGRIAAVGAFNKVYFLLGVGAEKVGLRPSAFIAGRVEF